jgi:hypothetical protein
MTKAPDREVRGLRLLLWSLDHSTEPSTVVVKMFLLFSSNL